MTESASERNPFVESLGIVVEEAAPERCVVAMNVGEEHTNSLGLIHGGVIFSLADRAIGLISNQVPTPHVTMEMHIRYLRPALVGQRLRAIAQRIHQGRETLFVRIDVVDERDRLIACLSGTAHAAHAPQAPHAQQA